jgi:hypothetical protein
MRMATNARYAIIAAILAASPALADGIDYGVVGSIDGIKGGVSGGGHGKVLLVNGTTFLLLNGGGKVCLAGGC